MNITYKNIIIAIAIIFALAYGVSVMLRPNYGQAEKIAKWQKIYNSLVYSFDAAAKHNDGTIIPQNAGSGYSLADFKTQMLPYLNYDRMSTVSPKYKYKKMNGKPFGKDYQFKYDDFFYTRNGVIYSLKENSDYRGTDEKPRYYLFVDINGEENPNVIGKDIFFVSIYREKIRALGYGDTRGHLKTNCSPLGSGVYCSEHYLLGGKF